MHTTCKQIRFWPADGQNEVRPIKERGGPRCVKPTQVSPAGLDDDGSTAAGFLLGLSHALPGFLVGVVCGTHRDFVLDPSQAVQLYAPFTG